MWKCFGFLTIVLAVNMAHANSASPMREPMVTVTHGKLEDFVGQKNAPQTIDAIISDNTSYLTGFELPIDLTTF